MDNQVSSHPDFIGLYGNQRIVKGYCERCQTYSFVLRGELQCCGEKHRANAEFYRRESEPEFKRRRPCPAMCKHILSLQGYRCFYCGRMFGSRARYRRRRIKLKVNWDHLVPFAYAQNNNTDNFVAACHICNSLKGAMMFQDIEQAQLYLLHEWGRRTPNAWEDNIREDEEDEQTDEAGVL